MSASDKNQDTQAMTQIEILAKLQSIFDALFIENVVITPSLRAQDVPEWDSLTHISLILTIEKTFGIRFQLGEVERAQNVGELADLISRRLSS